MDVYTLIPSLPVWECGLKLHSLRKEMAVLSVTPCVGVWIEMLEWKYIEPEEASLPVWECGLKLGS